MGRLKSFFSPPQLLALYRGVVRPCMEYASHIWGDSTHSDILDRVESKAFRIIYSPPLTESLQSLSARRMVASLSLFYQYYNKHCSSELFSRIPPPLILSLSTSLPPDLTAIRTLSCTYHVKSGIHFLSLSFLLTST